MYKTKHWTFMQKKSKDMYPYFGPFVCTYSTMTWSELRNPDGTKFRVSNSMLRDYKPEEDPFYFVEDERGETLDVLEPEEPRPPTAPRKRRGRPKKVRFVDEETPPTKRLKIQETSPKAGESSSPTTEAQDSQPTRLARRSRSERKSYAELEDSDFETLANL